MELTANEIDRLLSKLTSHNVNDETLASLGSIAESTETSRRFIEALLARQSPTENEDAIAVYGSMRILEEIAEKSELPACVLMAHLWLVANALQMHDICDSIDIWLSNCKSPDLSRHLLTLAGLQGDNDVRRHFEQLAV